MWGISWRFLVFLLDGVQSCLEGVIDSIAIWRYWFILRSIQSIREPVLKIVAIHGMLLVGQVVYEHLLVPLWMLFLHTAERNPIMDWVFYLLWSLPMIFICMGVNICHYHDIATAIRHIRDSKRQQEKKNKAEEKEEGWWLANRFRDYHALRKAAAEEIIRMVLLLVTTFLANQALVRTDWSCVKVICLLYISWIQSTHIFDHRWSIQCYSFNKKIDQVERAPAYHFGFGLWSAVILTCLPAHIASPLFNITLPFSVIATLYNTPRKVIPTPTTTAVDVDVEKFYTSSWPIFRVLLQPLSFIMVLIVCACRCKKIKN